MQLKLSGKGSIAIVSLLILIIALFGRKIKGGNKRESNRDYLHIGQLVFDRYADAFVAFYHLYQENPAQFSSTYAALLKEVGVMDVSKMTPYEVVYAFARSKNLVESLDWRGEEEVGELQEYAEKIISKKCEWNNTSALYKAYRKEDRRDGIFVIDLFTAVDEDLQEAGYRILFLDQGTDAYVFTVTKSDVYEKLKDMLPADIYGVEWMRKLAGK